MEQRTDIAELECAQVVIVGVGEWGCNRLNELPDDVVSMTRLVAVDTDPFVLANNRAHSIVRAEEGCGLGPLDAALNRGYVRLLEAIAEADLILVLGTVEDDIQKRLFSDVVQCCGTIDAVIVPVCPISSVDEESLGNMEVPIFPEWHGRQNILSIPEGRWACEWAVVLCQGLSSIILISSVIAVDFSDVRSVLKEQGDAFVTLGKAKGINRAQDAMRTLMEMPGLTTKLVAASAVLVVIFANNSLTIEEYSFVGLWVDCHVSCEATIVVADVHEEAMGESDMKVLMVATGINYTSVPIVYIG